MRHRLSLYFFFYFSFFYFFLQSDGASEPGMHNEELCMANQHYSHWIRTKKMSSFFLPLEILIVLLIVVPFGLIYVGIDTCVVCL